jgi:FkbH-like protein
MQLIEALNIVSRGPSRASDSLAIGLVCGFTPLHLRSFLQASLQLCFPSHSIEIVTGLFGDVPGTLRELKSKQLDAVALVLEWEDLDSRLGIRQLGGWGLHSLDDLVERSGIRLIVLQQLLEELSGSVPVAISLPTLPLPPLFFPAGWESSALELKLREQLASWASSLGQHQTIRVVNEQKLSLLSPMSERLDVRSTWLTGFPYRLSHASSLAEVLARLIQDRPPKKGLITDLDNTLWNGIVGEIGAQGVNWDLDHHSQAHGLYQQMLQTLSEEGVLVAVVSKNDPEVVEEAFRRDDLILSKDRISVLDVSWGSKAKAVTRILTAWNVGPDSVIFIDDSPLELAEVKASHPDLECFCFPRGEATAIYELLVHLRELFGKSTISEEDQLRSESIRRSAAIRISAEDSQGFSDSLLEQAGAELTLSFRKDAEDSRAFALVNKTNQFNLNGKRLTDAAWRGYLQQKNSFLLTASYKDRFGALGKIAVLAGRVEGLSFFVDIWVMSCRAFARRIEHQCLNALFRRLEINHISFDYVETPRNNPIARFFAEVSGHVPDSTVSISPDRFQSVCPKLFHQIVVLNDE